MESIIATVSRYDHTGLGAGGANRLGTAAKLGIGRRVAPPPP